MSSSDAERVPGGGAGLPGGAKPGVLVVDDDVFMLGTIRRVLSRFYDVTVAASALDALGVLSDRHVAVLLDVRMPVHDTPVPPVPSPTLVEPF